MKQVHIAPKQASQVPTGQMRESPYRTGTEAAGRMQELNTPEHEPSWQGHILSYRNDHSTRLRLGTTAFQQGPIRHEILENDTTFQPNALAVPCSSLSCTHQGSEEPPSWVLGADGHPREWTHSRNAERAKSMRYAQDLWGLAGAAWTHRFTYSAISSSTTPCNYSKGTHLKRVDFMRWISPLSRTKTTN